MMALQVACSKLKLQQGRILFSQWFKAPYCIWAPNSAYKMYTFQDKKMKQTFPSNSARNSALTGKTPSIASSRSVNSSVLMQSVQQGFEQQSSSNQAFQAFPNQIVFQDFEAPGNYQECISFRNNDNVSYSHCSQSLPLCRYREGSVSLHQSPAFSVWSPSKKTPAILLLRPAWMFLSISSSRPMKKLTTVVIW